MKVLNIISTAVLVALLGVSCTKDTTQAAATQAITQNSANSGSSSQSSMAVSDYSPCLDDVEISADLLPMSIIDYMVTNHPELLIEEAENVGDGQFYIVTVEDPVEMELLFDATGALLATQEETPEMTDNESLSAAVMDYITATYPGSTTDEWDHDLEFGILYTEVELSTGEELLFDAEGNFLCMELEDNDDGTDDVDDNDSDDEDSVNSEDSGDDDDGPDGDGNG